MQSFALVVSGLFFFYLGERTLEETARYAVDALGFVAVLGGLLIALRRWRSAAGDERLARRSLLLEYVVASAALVLYTTTSDLLGDKNPIADLLGTGDAKTIAQLLWPALLVMTLPSALAMELALRSMAGAGAIEGWRVRFAARAARTIGLVVISFAALNYASSQWSKKVDLSYFQTTKPGTSNQKILDTLTQPVKLILFFPAGNEVMEHARAYLDELVEGRDRVEVVVADQALDVELARKYKIRNNGYLVIASDSRDENIRLGLELEDARSTLRKLDSEVQERLMKVLRPPRTAYLTTGHLERDYAPPADDKRLGLADLKTVLEDFGLTVKRLGLGEGLGSKVPDDASVVFVVGPLEPFNDAELQSLGRYVQGGGRLFVMVDPDHGQTLEPLLAPLGLRAGKALVASDDDRYLWRIEGSGPSPYRIVTAKTTTHVSVDTLSRGGGRLALLLNGAGSLEKLEQPPKEAKITMTVQSMPQSFVDVTADGKLGGDAEKRGTFDLAAAVELAASGEADAGDEAAVKQPGRAIVLADADAASNSILRNPGNAYFVVDSLRWLVGEEDTAGTVESEVDQPVVHLRDQDSLAFYGTSIVVPAAVLFGGVRLTRRRKQKPTSTPPQS